MTPFVGHDSSEVPNAQPDCTDHLDLLEIQNTNKVYKNAITHVEDPDEPATILQILKDIANMNQLTMSVLRSTIKQENSIIRKLEQQLTGRVLSQKKEVTLHSLVDHTPQAVKEPDSQALQDSKEVYGEATITDFTPEDAANFPTPSGLVKPVADETAAAEEEAAPAELMKAVLLELPEMKEIDEVVAEVVELNEEICHIHSEQEQEQEQEQVPSASEVMSDLNAQVEEAIISDESALPVELEMERYNVSDEEARLVEEQQLVETIPYDLPVQETDHESSKSSLLFDNYDIDLAPPPVSGKVETAAEKIEPKRQIGFISSLAATNHAYFYSGDGFELVPFAEVSFLSSVPLHMHTIRGDMIQHTPGSGDILLAPLHKYHVTYQVHARRPFHSVPLCTELRLNGKHAGGVAVQSGIQGQSGSQASGTAIFQTGEGIQILKIINLTNTPTHFNYLALSIVVLDA
ncbi:hypothetical protein [Paenibacillus taiwanensis]|uniref:hypothetical protein n=1 Tax=Paenibacillus taiwanensis TaxID=401638 RepID=UPI00048E3F38|nr:hypothetical protein [Paenibacillus taiwanensis]